jgi:Carboxypeptidase regulatory-like domain
LDRRRHAASGDYGHDNPGTLVDVEVSGGALVVTRTSTFVPGSFALSGVVTEVTPGGIVPVEGVAVFCGVGNDTRNARTDRDGFYTLLGMFDGTGTVVTNKDGYAQTRHPNVLIKGATRLDIRLVRQ